MNATLGRRNARRLLRDCGAAGNDAHHEEIAAGYAWSPRGCPAVPVCGWRLPDECREARRERPEAREPDGHADLGDREVRDAEEVLGSLDPAPGEVADRRLAVRRLEAPGEVVFRHPGNCGEPVEIQLVRIPAVDVVPGLAQVRQQARAHREGGRRHPGQDRGPRLHSLTESANNGVSTLDLRVTTRPLGEGRRSHGT